MEHFVDRVRAIRIIDVRASCATKSEAGVAASAAGCSRVRTRTPSRTDTVCTIAYDDLRLHWCRRMEDATLLGRTHFLRADLAIADIIIRRATLAPASLFHLHLHMTRILVGFGTAAREDDLGRVAIDQRRDRRSRPVHRRFECPKGIAATKFVGRFPPI